MPDPLETTADVLEYINARHGWTFALTRRLPGGHQSGAYLLCDDDGERAVLKWTPDRSWASKISRTAPVVDRVRAAGWPTPAWLAAGVTPDGAGYQVQEFVLGRPMARIGSREVPLLLDLVEKQSGLDPDPTHDWSGHVQTKAFDFDGPAFASVRASGAQGQRIAEMYEHLVRPYRDVQLPTGDLVHGDLGSQNVLVHHSKISGVIDVEAIGSGTRVIDLALLFREGYLRAGEPPALARIRQVAEDIAGPDVMAICVTSAVIGVLHFVLRHVGHEIARCLDGAERLACDLSLPG